MIRIKTLTTCLVICLANPILAQVSDDFSSNLLSENWQGDDSLFMVNASGELQLNGSVAKDASLAIPFVLSTNDTLEWSFYTRFMLSPSTQNFSRFYIWSSSVNLKAATDGYYVQLGGVAGNTDTITFYRQSGTTRTKLISGRASTVAKTNNKVRIKLMRDPKGVWMLFSDTSGGNRFVKEGEGMDTMFTGNGWIGWFIRYSAGNAKNHYLDEVYAGPLRHDTSAPRINRVEIAGEKELTLYFNEPTDTASHHTATILLNGSVHSSMVYDDVQQSISLTFEIPLTNKTINSLIVKGIKDEAGNETDTTLSFLYNMPVKNDVLISEFFPDPSPVVGLPEAEFIELYNNSSLPVNLDGWHITNGSTIATLPSYVLPAASFLSICPARDTALFSSYGPALGVSAWPSLNNTAGIIRVLAPGNNLIYEVQYDHTWYKDDSKSDGGYSIEMISPLQLCKGSFNYKASNAGAGGTPGDANSVWNKNADTTAPAIIKTWIVDSSKVMMLFDEPLDSLVLQTTFSVASYLVNDVLLYGRDTVMVRIKETFLPNTTVVCTVNGIRDCSGNKLITTVSVPYVVPEEAAVFDVLINEIMAAPLAGKTLPAHEYIELYNRSKRIVSLKSWSLEDVAQKAIFNDQILYPDSFVTLCTPASRGDLLPFGTVLTLDKFPSLGNDEDALVLRNSRGELMHSVRYKRSFHTDAIKAAGGWSLEMKDPQNPCAAKENWTSSSHPDGGTPGKTNASVDRVPDRSIPKLLRIYPLSDTTLRMEFNEPIHPRSVIENAVIKGTQAAKSLVMNDPFLLQTEVSFLEKMEREKMYKMSITGISDCVGNVITEENYVDYGLPQTPDSQDLAINEVLFDPLNGGADFVEIVNRTDKVLDLKNIWIANTNEQQEVKDFYPLHKDGLMLLPHQYVVFTEDPASVMAAYRTPYTSMVLSSQMPSLPDDKGCVLLTDAEGLRYDVFCYDEDMHFALLDEKEGVSLERVSMYRPSNDRTNWASASYTAGYATPAYQNSQHDVIGSSEKTLSVTPEVFSPDGDGYHDLVHFSYKLGSAQNTGNLYIYNDQGLLVKHLLKNALLGSEGVFSWDGMMDSGNKAGIGIYLVYFETFDLQGNTSRYKTRLVVAAKW